jgi:HEPN domain-containing protein
MGQEQNMNYWLETADYDFETAKTMLVGKRFLYVGFMCHQTIEKALKAYYVFKLPDAPPHTHNLSHLAKKADLYNNLSEQQKDLLDTLEPLNIEARYPTHKERIAQFLNEKRCEEIIKKTEEFYQWIKAKLTQK